MAETENKDLVRAYVETVLNHGDLNALADFFAADCIDHTAPGGALLGRAGIGALLAATLAAFSDVRVTIEDLVAEGDTVASRLTLKGRHTGEFMGMAATGAEINTLQISIDRIADGRIVEHWGLTDQSALLQQLGGGVS